MAKTALYYHQGVNICYNLWHYAPFFSNQQSIHNLKTIQSTLLQYIYKFKGRVHLNIIFSYMKVNQICNLDHPVY